MGLIVVNILQYIPILNHYIVHLKLIYTVMSVIPEEIKEEEWGWGLEEGEEEEKEKSYHGAKRGRALHSRSGVWNSSRRNGVKSTKIGNRPVTFRRAPTSEHTQRRFAPTNSS